MFFWTFLYWVFICVLCCILQQLFYEGVCACFAQFDCQHDPVHRILKTLTLWTPFVIGLTKRTACIGQTEDTSSAQIVSVKQIAPFFACSDGDRWRDRVHCGHCHPRLTMWQLLKRKARSCLTDTLLADARFLSSKRTDYRQSLHVWKGYEIHQLKRYACPELRL